MEAIQDIVVCKKCGDRIFLHFQKMNRKRVWLHYLGGGWKCDGALECFLAWEEKRK